MVYVCTGVLHVTNGKGSDLIFQQAYLQSNILSNSSYLPVGVVRQRNPGT